MAIVSEIKGAALQERAWLVKGAHVYALVHDVTMIGRRADNDIVLHEESVARHHATIRYSDGKFVLHDLDSRGGTVVNFKRVKSAALQAGDIVIFADQMFVFVENQTDD